MASGGKIATISGLAIAAAGALFTGIQSWPVISGSNNNVPAASQKAEQSGGTTNCANVQGGAGTVDCRTITTAPPKPNLPEMEFAVTRSPKDKPAIDFIRGNLDKVIRITAHIPRNEGWEHEDTSGFNLGCDPNDVAYEDCPAAAVTMPLKCSTSPELPCLLNGNGELIVQGYFTAYSSGEKMGYFGVILRSIPPEAVRLR